MLRLYIPTKELPKDVSYSRVTFGNQPVKGIALICFILLNFGLGLFSDPIVNLIEQGLGLFS